MSVLPPRAPRPPRKDDREEEYDLSALDSVPSTPAAKAARAQGVLVRSPRVPVARSLGAELERPDAARSDSGEHVGD